MNSPDSCSLHDINHHRSEACFMGYASINKNSRKAKRTTATAHVEIDKRVDDKHIHVSIKTQMTGNQAGIMEPGKHLNGKICAQKVLLLINI